MPPLRSLLFLVWASSSAFACEHNDNGGGSDSGLGGTDGTDGGGGAPVCDTDPGPAIGGQWVGEVLQWLETPNVTKDAPYDDMRPHHPEVTAIHAAHLPIRPDGQLSSSGQFLMYHGDSDQRLWTVGLPSQTMQWLPIPFAVDPALEYCSYPLPPNAQTCYIDIFCSHASLMPDGARLFVAGGNIDGSAGSGGLVDTFIFDTRGVDPSVPPFGWTKGPDMSVDRWYPTVIELPAPVGARYLIAGGTSRVPGGRNTFEVYDPIANTMTLLPVEFEWGEMPLYPFLFVLPNGDVLYAGGEGAVPPARNGRVLIPDYNNGGNWAWANRVFASTTDGGSAVQWEPGKILKSGGVEENSEAAVTITETIDLSPYSSGNYQNAPDFAVRDPMHFPRHYHQLTLLCDGSVLATGGNEKGNGELWHRAGNPCDYPAGSDALIKETSCQQPNDCPAVPSLCRQRGGLGLVCPALGNTACADAGDCAASCQTTQDCAPGAVCASGRCGLQWGPVACQSSQDCSGGQACVSGACLSSCVNDTDCGDQRICADGSCVFAAAGVCDAATGTCDPYNNQCYATKAAEVLSDPECGQWRLLDEEENPRMYHSSALLGKDCNVISMGGGHRQGLVEQPNAQWIVPDYGGGDEPVVSLPPTPHLGYGPESEIQVMVHNAEDFAPSRVNLVKLGSVTHSFNVDQRFVPVEADWEQPWTGAMPFLTVKGPTSVNHAPPGYYMLVVQSQTGRPSQGQYVRVGSEASASWACPATANLIVRETSCLSEPSGGGCTSPDPAFLDVPIIDGPMGPTPGFVVVTAPGVVEDPMSASTDELAAVEQLCTQACELEWADDPAIAATCDAMDAFATPQFLAVGELAALDLVMPSRQSAQGVFPGQQLDCMLGSTCSAAFDESIARALPQRSTPAGAVLGEAEEWRVSLGTGSAVQVITNVSTYSSTLSGSVGYGFCRDGNAQEPCPFFLGSLDAAAQSTITATMNCDGGGRQTHRIENLLVQLGQPAFGIQAEDSTQVGFPGGAMILKTSFDVGRNRVSVRRPNGADVVGEASGQLFSAGDLDVQLTVPCGQTQSTITVRLTLEHPSDGSALDHPPEVSITTPAQVDCSGGSTALTADASDRDDDLVSVRWLIDGVLMSSSVTTLSFTTGHVLEAVATGHRAHIQMDTTAARCASRGAPWSARQATSATDASPSPTTRSTKKKCRGTPATPLKRHGRGVCPECTSHDSASFDAIGHQASELEWADDPARLRCCSSSGPCVAGVGPSVADDLFDGVQERLARRRTAVAADLVLPLRVPLEHRGRGIELGDAVEGEAAGKYVLALEARHPGDEPRLEPALRRRHDHQRHEDVSFVAVVLDRETVGRDTLLRVDLLGEHVPHPRQERHGVFGGENAHHGDGIAQERARERSMSEQIVAHARWHAAGVFAHDGGLQGGAIRRRLPSVVNGTSGASSSVRSHS